jgi:predicted ATP-dependent serine protease
MYSDTQIMIWGQPGNGKTVWLLKFAQYMAEKLAMKVLYIANEEFNRSTLTEKIKEFNIGHANLFISKDLASLNQSGMKLDDFDVVFFDSINSLGMDLKEYKHFVEANPGKVYVLIVQSTKDGDFRGGKDWEHEVDIAGEIKARKLELRKNRLDKDFLAKQEAKNQKPIEGVKTKKAKRVATKKKG